jgi:hypothetical protein
MKNKNLFLIGSLVLMTAGFARSQSTTDYQKTLKRMFEVSGTQESYKVAITQMFGMLKQQQKNVPDEVWVELQNEFNETSLTDLVEMLTPVYEKHLTQADLQKVIDFYQSAVGKKFASKTPDIMQESMQVGQQWGMRIGQKFQERLKEKGY